MREPNRLVLIALLLACWSGILGCSGESPTEPRAAASPGTLASQPWYFRAESSLRAPTRDGGGWYFDFPIGRGANVNYLYTSCCDANLLHRRIDVAFSVEASAARYGLRDAGDALPATVHVFLQRQDDDLQRPDGRWWASASRVDLSSDGLDVQRFAVPVEWQDWSNVFGQRDQRSFEAAAAHIGAVGFTFGGQFFFGHGVFLEGGASRFRLLEFSVD